MRELICPICGGTFTAESGRRKYCSLNCARKAEASRKYYNNPKRFEDYNHKGYLSKAIIARYNGRCAICGWRASEALITSRGRTQYAYGNEIHHIEAVEDGGKATEDNLILLCPNHHKQANLGIISLQELKSYIVHPPTDTEKQAMRDSAVDRVATVIFSAEE